MVALLIPARVVAAGWGGAIGASSDNVLRGVSLSDRSPSIQGDLHYDLASGWFLGVAGETINYPQDSSIEQRFTAYGGHQWVLPDNWGVQLQAAHYVYPKHYAGFHYDYDEISASASFANYIFLSFSASPNYSAGTAYGWEEDRWMQAYDLGIRLPLPHALFFNAGVGYENLHALFGTGYYYWNGGLGYEFQHFQLGVGYIGTSGEARVLFQERANDRWVVSLTRYF